MKRTYDNPELDIVIDNPNEVAVIKSAKSVTVISAKCIYASRAKIRGIKIGEPTPDESEGLTKREYFAGLAMQGMIASDPVFNAINPQSDKDPGDVRREFGAHCCDMADALIAALNEQVKGNE